MSEVQIEWVDTPLLEPMPFSRRYKLHRDMEVRYIYQGEKKRFVVPKNYITDGASIPPAFWQLIGTPYAPEFITGALAHDFCYGKHFDVPEMSAVFFELLKLSDVKEVEAYLMEKGVYAYTSLFDCEDPQ